MPCTPIRRLSATPPSMNGSAAAGTSPEASAGDHVHPSDTSKLNASLLGQPNGPAALDAQGNFAGLAFVFGSAHTLTPTGTPIRAYTSPDTSHAYIAGGDYTSEYTGMPATIYQRKQDGVIWTVACQSATYDSENNRTVLTADPGSFGTSGYVSANPASVTICGAFNTVSGAGAYAEGLCNTSSGTRSHAEGRQTTASGICAHAEGHGSIASGNYSHAEGYATNALGHFSHAEGFQTTASGQYSHAEGYATTASASYSHAMGHTSLASGNYARAEGYSAVASGDYSHAEGYGNTASGARSHAEGSSTTASGTNAHSEGYYTTASAMGSNALGYYSTAAKQFQTAQSSGRFATAGDAQHTKLVLRRLTTDATAAELTINGSAPSGTTEITSNRFICVTGKTYACLVQLAARKDDGTSALFLRQVIIKNVGGTVSLEGSPQTVGVDINPAGWPSPSFTADDTNKSLQILVTGAASTNIRWCATVHAQEIGY